MHATLFPSTWSRPLSCFFGKILQPILEFILGSTTLEIKIEEKYVGVTFSTDAQNILEAHYKAKARTARWCGHRMMAVEDMTGRLTAGQILIGYSASSGLNERLDGSGALLRRVFIL
jgi:hypothetical protein